MVYNSKQFFGSEIEVIAHCSDFSKNGSLDIKFKRKEGQ
jgi:hypothetical protein